MTIQVIHQKQADRQAISLRECQKRLIMRRRRVAKRLYRRCPMFAVEYMQAEFPGYDYDTFVADITRKTRKRKPLRKAKSPLKRQGRYPLYQQALIQYHLTKDPEKLREAQYWRNRLYLPFEVVFTFRGRQDTFTFPSTTSVRIIQELGAIQYSSWEDLNRQVQEILRYSHIS